MTTEIYCGDCGAKLEASHEVCPKCGSNSRKYSAAVGEGSVGLVPSLRAKQRDPIGFVKKEVWSRWKRAGGTGHRAKEELVIDRTSDEQTTKIHRVWEMNEEGELEKVHDEKKTSLAKHRTRTK